MAKTRTGNFPIGFRRGWSDWQKNLQSVISFAKENDFEAIDVGDVPADQVKLIVSAGLRVGSVDLKRPWQAICYADPSKRRDAVALAAEYVKSIAALGIRNFFTVVFPDDDARDVKENFQIAVEGYGALADAIAPSGARIVMEGFPGSHPHYPALCCTPIQLRAFFRETKSSALAINFDPSHLIRMGIDPVRFLSEFGSWVGHVHAKDTEVMEDEAYDFGTLQQATIADVIPFGGYCWRYTIPGHGVARWGKMLELLKTAGYQGAISVELEDRDFNGSEAGEKRGLLASRDFLMNT
jgi:sugar phosphate isomerase/epimerase